jgi:predicted RNase H-like HicB family nuclease
MDVKIIRLKVKILVERDDDSFHAYCPDLKGLHVGGDTEKEAVANAVEAVKAYLESLVKHNEPIPVGVIDGETWSMRSWLRDRLASWSRESYVKEVQLPVPA